MKLLRQQIILYHSKLVSLSLGITTFSITTLKHNGFVCDTQRYSAAIVLQLFYAECRYTECHGPLQMQDEDGNDTGLQWF
jgi:hypothetical protein